MLHSSSLHRKTSIKKIIRNNIINILAFTGTVIVLYHALIGIVIYLVTVYIILAQFRDIPLHNVLRNIGYDCFYFQFNTNIILDNEAGALLQKYKDDYIHDYIRLGYTKFDKYINEILMIDKMFKHITVDDILASCFD